ncbi:MAG TPA: peptidoglycan-associated lipoprotein Pal [Burkholderiales bacterium]|jgi:peptidoglycan-associated lipoprotein
MNFFVRYGLALAAAASLGACATGGSQDAASGGAQSGTAAATSGSAASRQPSGDAVAAARKTVPVDRSVYYEFDRAELKPESRALIEAHASYLRDNPAVKVKIEGNADERGSSEYNLALGQRRAETVAGTLKLLGIPESRMEAVSFGKEKPRKTGHDETSWAENRRSDLVY